MGFSVLIADGNAHLVASVKAALEGGGIRTITATDGYEAIRLIADHKPALVVAALDLTGVSGFDLFARIRKSSRGAKIPLIAVSERMPEDERRQLTQTLRLSALVYRPVNVELLAGRIGAIADAWKEDGSPEGKVFAGRLAKQPLYAVFLFLHRHRLSGRLTLEGPEKIVVDIAGGKPYHVEDYHFGLAENLREREILDEEEFDFFLSKTLEEGEESLEWLVRMGVLSVDALRLEKDRYLMAKLAEPFSWDGGAYHFRGAETQRRFPPLSAINLPELIHRGLLGTASSNSLGDFFQRHQDRYLAVTPGFHDLLYFLKLEPYEVDIVDLLTGEHRFRELVSEGKGRWSPEQAIGSVFVFKALGMLAFETERPSLPVIPRFPMRKRPPVEDVDYVKVSVGELDSLIAERRFEGEEAEDLWADDSEEFLSVMDGDLGELAGGFDPEAGGMTAGEPAWAQPRQVDPEQEKLEEELLAFHELMGEKNYYELFDLTFETFDFGRMKEQYHRLVRRFSPEQFVMSPGQMMAASEDVLSQIAAAFNVLSNVVSKEQYDEQIRKAPKVPMGGRGSMEIHIGVQFNSGLAFLEEGDFASAENAFREVLDARSDHFEAIAHFAWAMYAQKGRRGNKTFADQAMRHLRTAQNELPDMAEVYAYRGMILLDQGKMVLAEIEFKKALSRKPKLRLALEGLTEIDRRRAGTRKKGFFSRRFA